MTFSYSIIYKRWRKESWQRVKGILNSSKMMLSSTERIIQRWRSSIRLIIWVLSKSALKHWSASAKQNAGDVISRGSGNYSSDEAKEIARLRRQLRDAKDALEILKKAISILGKWPLLFILRLKDIPMRSEKTIRNAMFRSAGYCIISAFPNLVTMPGGAILPPGQKIHRNKMKGKIQEIYQQSHQIYGAPKIAAVLHKNGD
jgi:transposase-like protein